MKKIIMLLIILVLMSSLVMAENPQKGQDENGKGAEMKEIGQETGQGEQIQEETKTQEKGQTQEKTQQRVRNEEMIQRGLTNALTRVRNENAREMITRNLNRFQERFQERLERMENVEVTEVDEETGEVEVEADTPVKYFGFIKGKARHRFEINNEGVINEKKPWYSFIYSEA